MSQPFNQQLDDGEARATQAAFPCPHTGGVDDDGYCLTCDRPGYAKECESKCDSCGAARDQHAAVGVFNDERWCPIPDGFSATSVFTPPTTG